MIMRRGQQLLLPANPLFIWSSLLAALVLTCWPNMGLLGTRGLAARHAGAGAGFWTIHQPLRVGMGAAFVFGLAMDVHQGGLLGQHALAYTVLSFLAIAIHRRLLWFSVPSQAAQVLPLFAVAHALSLLLRMLAGGDFPGCPMLLAPLLEALLWPVVSVLLLLPQRRAPDPDANRPL